MWSLTMSLLRRSWDKPEEKILNFHELNRIEQYALPILWPYSSPVSVCEILSCQLMDGSLYRKAHFRYRDMYQIGRDLPILIPII